MTQLAGSCVLVTGAAGTIGQELVRQLVAQKAAEIRAFDVNESELFSMSEQFRGATGSSPEFRPLIGDIRDADRLAQIMDGASVVFHAAALKHVVLCEESPFDAVRTNVIGTQNVIRAATQKKVGRVVFTSSDKAVNPTNVMGTSKLMGERLVTAASASSAAADTIFTSTRFGNVVGSRGSVVPLFFDQIRRGEALTLTDPRMSRFIMSAEEAVRLVLRAAELAVGGEVFVTKMPVIRIEDLAQAMINDLAGQFGHEIDKIKIQIIGSKPGEKYYEELMTEEESSRAMELAELFSVLPAFRDVYRQRQYDYPDASAARLDYPYVSENVPVMSVSEISTYLKTHGIYEKLGASFSR